MTTTPASAALLQTLETYYDTVPRASASSEQVGPFTLFVKDDPSGFDYYARPTRGTEAALTSDDVRRVRARMRERRVPEAVEWVHDTTPSLLAAATDAGLRVHLCPLLVLPDGARPPARTSSARVEVLRADTPGLGAAVGAVDAGFSGSDEVPPRDVERLRGMVSTGLMAMVGAFEGHRAVGGGSHSPRSGTTELAGIAVIPSARGRGVGADLTAALVEDALDRGVRTVFLSAQDDAVARIYERVGFVPVGTACIAEPDRT